MQNATNNAPDLKRIARCFVYSVLLVLISFSAFSQVTPKREFRGAWLHVVGSQSYKNMKISEMKRHFIRILDSLHACNINALIFQVRPCADALYYSNVELWSAYLSGKQGRAPEGDFDPMEFLIFEAHQRNMEFHAWLNPYRVTISANDVLSDSHLYYRRPKWFIKYDGKIYFDPGMPESRKHICKVVKDIVKRYDVDAIHFDDYFYPYPVAGKKFSDDYSFRKHSNGFKPNERDDWRRNNVNLLIKDVKRTIKRAKSWVRFGISPFGIYRNKKNTPDGSGSNTNGLQNYDNLYADIKLWVEKGWIDYNIPQIYWEIGHPAADYETLIKWWSCNNYGAHLYIGQNVSRMINAPKDANKNQLSRKMELERNLPAVYGNCFWSAYDLVANKNGIADSLKKYYQPYPALIPPYLHLRKKSPAEVKSLKDEWTPNGYILRWKQNGNPKNPKNAQYYIVYRFANSEKIDLDDPSKIVCITRETSYVLPYENKERIYQYVVTAVDRFHNETKGKSRKVTL